MSEELVKDAMVSEPLALEAAAPAQAAGEALARPDVRAVFVCDDGTSALLADAFAYLEEHDYERVPVVDDGKLVGVLSRAVVQRRLAEDEEVPGTDGA